jgi:hypothetical protein
MRSLYFGRLPAAALAAVTAIGVSTAAFAQNSTVIIAPSAPPAPRVETMSPRPPSSTTTMSWQGGHWSWNGTNWVWDEGHYVQAPQAQAVWEPGHWQQQPTGGYVWVDGHWRS